jgi:S1-C subfamily serine protease
MRPRTPPFLRRLRWAAIAVLLVLAVWYFLPLIERTFFAETIPPRVITPRGDLAADERSMVELFEKSKPSVVYITTREQVFDLRSRNVLSVPLGTGSGFIWDEQGHVVTNHHVLSGAAEARVRLNDGGEYAAKLVGVSPAHDLAVLRINVPLNPLPPVPLGTSNELKVGQKVFAIGNPFGLDWTLTTGIVSALDRSLPNEDGSIIEHLIQTDAAINPGNSGGPLLDSAGRLIGINTAIFSPSGAYAGVGFAVPVDTVNRVVPQLIAKGSYTRPSLGISVNEELNRELTRRLGVEGVLVLEVQPKSSAAAAGLRGSRIGPDGTLVPGDLILSVAGQPVDSVPRLLARLDDHRVGDEVALGLLREGRKIEVKAALEAGS